MSYPQSPPPPPPPPPAPGQPYYQQPVVATSSSKATPALVLGIIGLVCCPVVCSVLAIIFGKQAKDEIDRNPGMEGRGQAQAGFILGIVSLSLSALGLLIWLVAIVASSGSGY